MEKKKLLKKTIGIDIDDYQIIKQYCDEKSLKISNFVGKLVLNHIKNENNEK